MSFISIHPRNQTHGLCTFEQASASYDVPRVYCYVVRIWVLVSQFVARAINIQVLLLANRKPESGPVGLEDKVI